MQKRGQFFLIAALVVVALLISLAVVSNYANVPEENTYVYELSRQIAYEGSQIIDQGVFSAKSPSEIDQRIQNLTEKYQAQQDKYTEFIVIYGDKNAVHFNATYYSCADQGGVTINSGGSETGLGVCTKTSTPATATRSPGTDKVIIRFPDSDTANLTMQLTEGQNFFVVVRTTRKEGTTVTPPR